MFPVQIYNLGTGRGYSVLEMVKAVEKASGRPVSVSTVFVLKMGSMFISILDNKNASGCDNWVCHWCSISDVFCHSLLNRDMNRHGNIKYTEETVT